MLNEIFEITWNQDDFEISYKNFWSVGPFVLEYIIDT